MFFLAFHVTFKTTRNIAISIKHRQKALSREAFLLA